MHGQRNIKKVFVFLKVCVFEGSSFQKKKIENVDGKPGINKMSLDDTTCCTCVLERSKPWR